MDSATFLYYHELLHRWYSQTMSLGANPPRWNVAVDMAINRAAIALQKKKKTPRKYERSNFGTIDVTGKEPGKYVCRITGRK